MTLGAPIALAALQSIADAGSSAKVVTFDLNADVAKQVQDGKILFSVDQQPWLQGYMAVDSLWFYLTNKNDPRRWPAGADRAVLRRQHQHRRHRQVRGQQHPLMHLLRGAGSEARSPEHPPS